MNRFTSAKTWTVASLVVVTVSAFVWNYEGLKLLVQPAVGSRLSWIFPLTIDGVMLAATLSLFFFGTLRRTGTAKTYCWAVLIGYGVLSAWAMFYHAYQVTGGNTVLSALMAGPSLSLALIVHMLMLMRQHANRENTPRPAPKPVATLESSPVERVGRSGLPREKILALVSEGYAPPAIIAKLDLPSAQLRSVQRIVQKGAQYAAQ